MTYLFNKPSAFANELIEGFVAAHQTKVRQVPGGVVRNTHSQPGSVAVVIGGGSGHYPAFAGLVGQGLAHGAAMGNLFASPSAQQICSVARAANNGGGVLLTFGNYAGDVLHFGLARDRLVGEGIPCEIVLVTDDISSASKAEREKRRGVAGDLVVFKVAAAAAEQGRSLAEVARIARLTNQRIRSFGVAFSGCTLPGADHPLFSIPHGKMALGMGIHGEPGIGESDIPTADELADVLVKSLLDELPDDITDAKGQRVGVILNGLGSVKYEELFVVYRRIAQLLNQAGIMTVDAEVGEFVTSFNMAGASLTLFWLDDELEPLWRASADAPAFRKGSVIPAEPLEAQKMAATAAVIIPTASAASKKAAQCLVGVFNNLAQTIMTHADELGRIDAVAGDGDHGIGMERGALAAAEKAAEMQLLGAGAGTLLQQSADAWSDRAGGTSGALWGLALNALGTVMGDEIYPDARTIADGICEAKDGIMHFGKAQVGDKTLVDVLVPFSETLSAAVQRGDTFGFAWQQAAKEADTQAKATANLRPKVGRARPLAEKSVGTPDAGAVSLALIVNALLPLFADKTSDGVKPREVQY